MILEQYSIGVGDRFAHQGAAQLCALQEAERRGVTIVPVWNKSFREHTIVGTKPADTRSAADNAVKECGWKKSYYVDADHIGLKNVDLFFDSSNFFTLDVADYIGKPAGEKEIDRRLAGGVARIRVHGLSIPGRHRKSPLKVNS